MTNADNGQQTTDNNNGQQTTDNGQRTTDNGQRTTDNASPLHSEARGGQTQARFVIQFSSLFRHSDFILRTSQPYLLHAVVIRIEHKQPAFTAARQPPGIEQLARFAAAFAPAAERLPVEREFLHAMVPVFHGV